MQNQIGEVLGQSSSHPFRHQGPCPFGMRCRKSRPWICLLDPHDLLSEGHRRAANPQGRPVQLLFHLMGVWLIQMKWWNTSTYRSLHCRYRMQHTPLDEPRHKRPLLDLNLKDLNYPMSRSIHPLRYFHHDLRNHISRRSPGTTMPLDRMPHVQFRHKD